MLQLPQSSEWLTKLATIGKTGDASTNCLTDLEYRESSPLAQSTKDSRGRFYEKLRSHSAKRFVKHIEDCVDVFILEAHLRERGDIPDLASYPALRRNNSASHISFDFVAFGLKFGLPEELFKDSGFLKVYYSAGDIIWWSDVCARWNTAKVMAGVILLQTPANFVREGCKKLMDVYFEERKNMESYGKVLDADLERYFDVLGQRVIANMEWSLETKRYFGEAFEEAQKTCLVKL